MLPNTEGRRAKRMNRQLRLRDGKIKTAYWSLVGVVAALLVSTQAVFAADMWDRFSMIMKDIYGELVGDQHHRGSHRGRYCSAGAHDLAQSASRR